MVYSMLMHDGMPNLAVEHIMHGRQPSLSGLHECHGRPTEHACMVARDCCESKMHMHVQNRSPRLK